MCFRHRLGWVFGGPQGVGCVFCCASFRVLVSWDERLWMVQCVGRGVLIGASCGVGLSVLHRFRSPVYHSFVLSGIG